MIELKQLREKLSSNNIDSKDILKRLMKIYANDLMYRAINKIMMEGEFGKISTYLRNTLNYNEECKEKMMYNEF